jgi:hypothetical protein
LKKQAKQKTAVWNWLNGMNKNYEIFNKRIGKKMSISTTINCQVSISNFKINIPASKFLICLLSLFFTSFFVLDNFAQAQETPLKQTAPPPWEPSPLTGNNANDLNCSFEGEWQSYLGEIVLLQYGTDVEGMAAYEDTKIKGSVSGFVMTGSWMRPPYKSTSGLKGGDFILSMASNCQSFMGTWRYGTEKAGDDFYGWNKWPAKRIPEEKNDKVTKSATQVKEESKPKAILKKPLPNTNNATRLPDNKQTKIAELNRQIDEISEARVQSEEMRLLWKMVSDQIDAERDSGNNISNLKRNLDNIQSKVQKARKRNVALNKQYGNVGDIEKKIKALAAQPKKKQMPVEDTGATTFPLPGFGIPSGLTKGTKRGSGHDKKYIGRSGDVARPAPNLPQDETDDADSSFDWAMYKIKINDRAEGTLPNLDVVETIFSKTAELEKLTTTYYPVTLVKSFSGSLLWSISWQNGRVIDTKTNEIPSDLPSLQRQAERAKAGSVTKNELDTLINNSLAPNAKKKDPH